MHTTYTGAIYLKAVMAFHTRWLKEAMPAAQSCSHFVNILVPSGTDSLTLSVRCEYHRSRLMAFKDIHTLNE